MEVCSCLFPAQHFSVAWLRSASLIRSTACTVWLSLYLQPHSCRVTHLAMPAYHIPLLGPPHLLFHYLRRIDKMPYLLQNCLLSHQVSTQTSLSPRSLVLLLWRQRAPVCPWSWYFIIVSPTEQGSSLPLFIVWAVLYTQKVESKFLLNE